MSAKEGQCPPVQCYFDRGGIELDPVSLRSPGAADHTSDSGAAVELHQPQPKFRNWRRRPEAAPAGREGGLLAERVARLRLARAREKFAREKERRSLYC